MGKRAHRCCTHDPARSCRCRAAQCYGYVQFEREEDAQTAISKVNGMHVGSKPVTVQRYIRRTERKGSVTAVIAYFRVRCRRLTAFVAHRCRAVTCGTDTTLGRTAT